MGPDYRCANPRQPSANCAAPPIEAGSGAIRTVGSRPSRPELELAASHERGAPHRRARRPGLIERRPVLDAVPLPAGPGGGARAAGGAAAAVRLPQPSGADVSAHSRTGIGGAAALLRDP